MRKHFVIAFVLAAAVVEVGFTAAYAVPITYDIGDVAQAFGSGPGFTGSIVAIDGRHGVFDVPGDQFSVVELDVGALSITSSDPLSRDLAIGFPLFAFPVAVTIGEVQQILPYVLQLTVDQSNDGATLLGGRGVTAFRVEGLSVDFQLLTSATGAANAGETKSSRLIAQFYSSPVQSVPEPATLFLLGIGLLAGWLSSSRRKALSRLVVSSRLTVLLIVALLSAPVPAMAVPLEFSYAFGDGTVVNGTLNGEANGEYVDSVNDVSLGVNGVWQRGTFYLYGWTDNLGWTTAAARLAFDGSLNNLLISNEPLPFSGLTEYFYYVNSPNRCGVSSCTLVSIADPHFDSSDVTASSARWSLIMISVPEPGTLALLGAVSWPRSSEQLHRPG